MGFNLNNIFSKITKNADKLGSIGGYLLPFNEVAKVEGKDLISCLQGRHLGAISKLNFGNAMSQTIPRLQNRYWNAGIRMAIPLYLGGTILKELKLDPKLTQIGNGLSKAAVPMAIANVLAIFVGALAESSGAYPYNGSGSSGNSTNPMEGIYA